MSREVPFNPNEKCDICGAIGAYDFMGDCFCPSCAEGLVAKENEPTDGQSK